MAKPLAGVDPTESVSAQERARALIGRTISERYRIVDLLSMGGMGAIYRAEHLLMRKQVAIKVLHPETENFPELVSRFEREAIAGAHINHPNVASASDFGRFDGESFFLVLEFIEGMTLKDLVRQGPVAPVRAANIAKQLAMALGAAHQRGILHRDVKPTNIMLTVPGPNDTSARGQEDIVKLIDFGLAKVPVDKLSTAARDADPESRELTNAGVVMGTVAYMAPETALGMRAVQERADLYALGVILYEMLAGKHMFDAIEPQKLFAAHCTLAPPPLRERNPNSNVPAGLESIMLRLLEKDPDARYPDADALIAALEAFRMRDDLERGVNTSLAPPRHIGVGEYTPLPSAAAGSSLMPRRALKKRSNLWLWGGLVTVAAIGIGAALFAGLSGGDKPVPPKEVAAAPTATATATSEASASAAPATAAPAALASASGPSENDAIAKLLRDSASAGPDKAAAALVTLLENSPAKLDEPTISAAVSGIVDKIAEANLPDTDKIFSLLGKQGQSGTDVLFDLAGGPDGSSSAAKARATLADPTVLARGSVAMRMAHDLRLATCQKRTFLAPRAAKEGDDRSLMILSSMLPPGCELRSSACCFPKHPELESAIADIRARLRGQAPAAP